MLKRLLVLGLALAMALAVAVPFVGAQDDAMDYTIPEETEVNCGTEEEATVTIVTGAVGAEQEVTQQAVDFYMEKCSNVTVELFETPDSATDRLAFYLQFLEQESSDIDLYQIDVIWPAILAEHMVDMSQYASDDLIDSYFDPIVENNTVDGELVALPWFTDAGLLYYRTDLLEEYGLEVPQTWDELEAAAETIQAGVREETGNEDFWGFVWQGNSYEGLTCDAIEWQASSSGTTIVSPDGRIQVTDEAWIETLEQAAGWVGTISPSGVTSYQEEDARNQWQQGNAAFMRNWPYAFSLGNA
ncbi:MAG: extracellular solute-binding protein, partial [Anaerolineales bacterium]